MCESCEWKLIPTKIREHHFPTKLNSLTQGLLSKLNSPKVRLAFDCKLQKLVKMAGLPLSAVRAVGGGSRPAWLPEQSAFKYGSHVSIRVSYSCSEQEERRRGERTKAEVHTKALPSSSHSHPIGQNWSRGDFLPIKKSGERDEEKEGMNQWGGHLLLNLHLQLQ